MLNGKNMNSKRGNVPPFADSSCKNSMNIRFWRVIYDFVGFVDSADSADFADSVGFVYSVDFADSVGFDNYYSYS